ncbi:unnamed protein product, partial [Adineta steineri]
QPGSGNPNPRVDRRVIDVEELKSDVSFCKLYNCRDCRWNFTNPSCTFFIHDFPGAPIPYSDPMPDSIGIRRSDKIL